MDHCFQQPCVYSIPEHKHHTQTALAGIREEQRKGGREVGAKDGRRETDRAGGVALFMSWQ